MGKKGGKRGKADRSVENAQPNLPVILEEDHLEKSENLKEELADFSEPRKSVKRGTSVDEPRRSTIRSSKDLKSSLSTNKSILKGHSKSNAGIPEDTRHKSKTLSVTDPGSKRSNQSVKISVNEGPEGSVEKKEKGKKGKKGKKEKPEEAGAEGDSKQKKTKKEKKEKSQDDGDEEKEQTERKKGSKIAIERSVDEIKSATAVDRKQSRGKVADVDDEEKKDKAEQVELSDNKEKKIKGKKGKKEKLQTESKETQKDEDDESVERDGEKRRTKTGLKTRYSKVSFHSKTILSDTRASQEHRSEMVIQTEEWKRPRESKKDSKVSLEMEPSIRRLESGSMTKHHGVGPLSGSGLSTTIHGSRRIRKGVSASRLSTDTEYSDSSSLGSTRVDKEEHVKKKRGKKHKKDKKHKAENEEEKKERRAAAEKEKAAEKEAIKEEDKAEKQEAAAIAQKKAKGDKPLDSSEYEETKKRLEELKKIAKEMGVDITKEEEVDKGPKKKLTKKEKAKMTAEAAEKQRAEMEAQARRMDELIKKRKEEERLAAIERDKRETFEQGLRMEQLKASSVLIQEILDANAEIAKEERELIEWNKYVECGNLPNPTMVDQMNTYLHLWELVLEETSVEAASQKTQNAIKLLNDLNELIDTATEEDESKAKNWKWVRQLFRKYQAASLDVATYRLLRNVEHNLNRINIPTADFSFKDDYVTLCIWLRVMLPIPLPNPRRPPKPRIDIFFDKIDLSVLFPLSIDCQDAAIRAMYLQYDHLSDLCQTYDMREVPKDYHLDLLALTKKEWRTKLKYKYDNRDIKAKPAPVQEVQQEGGGSSPTLQLDSPEQKHDGPEKLEAEKKIDLEHEEQENFASDEDIPIVPFKQLKPTAHEHAIFLEDQLYNETRTKLLIDVPEHILNLRKFVILGGVYHLNLLAQPPQPQDFITMEMTITGLYLPKRLEVLPFQVVYTPYVPPEPELTVSSGSISRKLPEEIEDEMKKQEEELDKLISINIKWPQHVIFLELPIVCRWDEYKQHWSKEEIYDLKHNEEKFILSFRTGVFGIYGLATYRYVNLPFQAYEIKPEIDESVTLQLTLAMLMMEFNIKDGLISITQLQNSPNNTLQDVIGKYFKLHQLKRMMQESGLDIFPAFDAFCYLDGCCEKQWAMEQHLYYNMAQISNSFNFAWSRWNVQVGRRKIVLQMRPYSPESKKQKSHQMLLVTPLKAAFIECTEVSQTFSDKEIESPKFSTDLYHLMKNTSGIFVRNKVMKGSKQNVFALAQLLITTRIMSFS